MTPHQKKYVQQCYEGYKNTLGWCSRCDPDPQPLKKRWEDAVHSVIAYLNTFVQGDMGELRVLGTAYDIASWSGHTWKGGVFKGDDFDGLCGWYWRIEENDKPKWGDTPAAALLAFTEALEERFEMPKAAPGLVFIVRMPEHSCMTDDDHDWEHKWTGRHGSDKGVDHYECRACGVTKED